MMKSFKNFINEAPWDDEFRTPNRPRRDQLIDRGVRPEVLDRPWNPDENVRMFERIMMLIWAGVPLAVIAAYIPFWLDLLLLMNDYGHDTVQENEWGLDPRLTHPSLTPWFFDPNFLQLIEDGLIGDRDPQGRPWSIDNPPPGWWLENNQWNNDQYDPSFMEGWYWNPYTHQWMEPKRPWNDIVTTPESDAVVPPEQPDMPPSPILPTVNHPRM